MGADLYLNSVFAKNRAKYAPKLNAWAAKRDALQKAGRQQAATKAQREVSKYFDKMYARGYFRDSYNGTNLLWVFGLSWWHDVLDTLTDKEGEMSPENAQRFLDLLADKEPVFDEKLKKVKPAKGETRAEVEKYFRAKYEELKAFLRQAIAKQEPIECSL